MCAHFVESSRPLRSCSALLPDNECSASAMADPLGFVRVNTVHPDTLALIAASQSWINKEHVIGRSKGYLPYIGMVTIIMNDYPIVKYVLVGVMGLFVLTTRE